jgi:hypothetical protein
LGIFNPEKHGNKTVTVIGAGSVGSFVTLTLAKMGMKKIKVYDDDVVEKHNMPNQFYPIFAVRDQMKKVDALGMVIMGFMGMWIDAISKKYTKYSPSHIIISSVDSIEARRAIWKSIKPHLFKKRGTALYIDTRMGGEYMRIFTVSKKADIAPYEKTLIREGEHLPCTARTVVYNVVTVAGLVGCIIKAFLTGKGRMPTQVVFDMANLSMQVFPYVASVKSE